MPCCNFSPTVGHAVTAKAVVQQINALESWINQRWPGAKRHAEIPVEAIQNNGQIIQGRIDLLLEMQQGWILFDHKANPLGSEKWPEIAHAHSVQIISYGNAVAQATGKPIMESWLFFPMSGGAVKVENEVQ